MSRSSKEQRGIFAWALQARAANNYIFLRRLSIAEGWAKAWLCSHPFHCLVLILAHFLVCRAAQRQLKWQGHELGDADGSFRSITSHSAGSTKTALSLLSFAPGLCCFLSEDVMQWWITFFFSSGLQTTKGINKLVKKDNMVLNWQN